MADPDEGPEFMLRDLPSRRRFLTLMSASLALTGLAGCRKPVEKILPYVKGLEETVPGVPVHYASTMPLGINPAGILVSTFDGRPTKIEGLPDHPASLGASDLYMQAAILNLYDQDRSRSVSHDGKPSRWTDFIEAWKSQLSLLQARQGEGFAILSEPAASPTLIRMQKALKAALPAMKWVSFDPVNDETMLEAAAMACGSSVYPLAHLDKAEVVLALDADLLYSDSGHLRNAHGFAAGRPVGDSHTPMNRLYVAEPAMSITGGAADHRLRCEASRIHALALALGAQLGKMGVTSLAGLSNMAPRNDYEQRWLAAVAKDLLAHRGKSLILAGRRQPAEVHLVLFALNLALGNIGNTLTFRPLEHTLLSSTADLRELCAEMAAGRISHLAILGGNPVYSAPADFEFHHALIKVPFSLHLSDREDETSFLTTWHLPATHFLEEWGDSRSEEGRLSTIQPMIEPLFGGRSAIELLQILRSGEERSGYQLVRETWQELLPPADFEKQWRRLLHRGLHREEGAAPVKPDGTRLLEHIHSFSMQSPSDNTIELCFQPSALHDGRWANNAWLQELPDPITKIAWDNPARISKKLARQYGLANGDMAVIQLDGRALELPVWIVPAQCDNTIVLELGYGRSHAGRIGSNVGFNAGLLRTSKMLGFATGASLKATGGHYTIACAQDFDSAAGRPLVREATLQEFRTHPQFAREAVEHPPLKNLAREHTYAEGYQWGMVIDLNRCIGCNACTIACQSENNIPVVGKEQIAKGREMHWIRLDRYFKGDDADIEMVHQPVACQHCENAPCEQVCPVAATVHDHEGLNVMAYNRCVGTRYCSNNCPYKARRFNFFDYTKTMDDLKKMAQNPDVTVRMRGVMEKCTYCLQRLTLAKNKAKLEGRTLADGEVMTACQQACPTGAITFGNLLDPASLVSRARQDARSYALLGELNVRPRTLFAAKIRNRNPELS
jgi:molybdopterin-containing oxidoreductase family iron-sulfur binding subunit